MPSHISHSLFAMDLFSRLNLGSHATPGTPKSHSLHIGAQGPDIFFHNQRTMPSGLLIGSVLHRKGYGSVSVRMLEFCLTHNFDSSDPEGRYLLAFISHAILDRALHPYINYFGGWVDQEDPETQKFQNCHPFLERIIDLALVTSHKQYSQEAQGTESVSDQPRMHGRAANDVSDQPRSHGRAANDVSDQPLNFFRFAEHFDAGPGTPDYLLEMLGFALRKTYQRMSADSKLNQRIHNAYADSRGFYHFCEGPRSGEVPRRWAALLHPFSLPGDLDFSNIQGREWCDPCDKRIVSSENIYQIYQRALDEAERVCIPVVNILDGRDPPSDYPGLPSDMGDMGLRSMVSAAESQSPCTLSHSDPLPLDGVLEKIAADHTEKEWVSWDQRFTSENQ